MLQSIQLTATNRSRAYPMRLIEYDGLLLELFLGYVCFLRKGVVIELDSRNYRVRSKLDASTKEVGTRWPGGSVG